VRALYLTLFCLPVLAAAQSQTTDIRPYAERVTGEELLDSYINRTHDGAYNFDMMGDAARNYTEKHNDDGTVSYSEAGTIVPGAWWVARDEICYTYNTAGFEGGCFRVWRVENCFYYYSNVLPERDKEYEGDWWTARSVKRGEDATCEAFFS